MTKAQLGGMDLHANRHASFVGGASTLTVKDDRFIFGKCGNGTKDKGRQRAAVGSF
jgi:hypothetical protein